MGWHRCRESTLQTCFTSPCLHVRPTQTNTHRPMYSTVPLKNGRLLNLIHKDLRHSQKDSPRQRTSLKKKTGTYVTSWRWLWAPNQHGEAFNISKPLHGWTQRQSKVWFFLATYTVHVTPGATWVQSCERETSQASHLTTASRFQMSVFIIISFFLHRINIILKVLNWTTFFIFNIIINWS